LTLNKTDIEIARHVGVRSMAKTMTQLYNKLCMSCKMVTIRVTKRGGRVDIIHYCPACQDKTRALLSKLEKKK
jgi:formamidopyrimidine-DNA glycosylase